MPTVEPPLAKEEDTSNVRAGELVREGGFKSSVVAELAGLLKGAGDVDWRRDYADYLAEKYT